MNRYVYRLWPMLTFPEIPAYMEAMERRGLRFHHVNLFLMLLAAYEPIGTQGQDAGENDGTPQYCWDVFESNRPAEINEYQELCQLTGWRLVWQFGRHKIFRSAPGENPPPIREVAEYAGLLRDSVTPQALCAVLLILASLLPLIVQRELVWGGFAIQPLYVQLLLFIKCGLLVGPLCWLWKTVKQFMLARALALGHQAERQHLCTEKQRRCYGFLSSLFYGLSMAFFILWAAASLSGPWTGRFIGAENIVYMYFLMCWNGYIVRFTGTAPEEGDLPLEKTLKRKEGWKQTAVVVGLCVVLCIVIIPGNDSLLYRGSNLYCSEIYADLGNGYIPELYCAARSSGEAEAVIKAAARQEGFHEPIGRMQKEQYEKGASVKMAQGLAGLLETERWDEMTVYESQIIVRRDNQIWAVSMEEYSAGFMNKTGF